MVQVVVPVFFISKVLMKLSPGFSTELSGYVSLTNEALSFTNRRLVCDADIVDVGVFSGVETVGDGVKGNRVDVALGITLGVIMAVGDTWLAPEHPFINTEKTRMPSIKCLLINVVFIVPFRVV